MMFACTFLQRRYFAIQNIIKSNVGPIKIPELSLPEYLWPRLEKFGDKTAIVCFETGRSYTFNQIYQRSLSFGDFLRNNVNLHKNGSLGIVLGNVPDYPIIMLGAIQAGLKVTTCNPTYTPDEIQRQLQNSDASILVTSTELLPKVIQLNLPTIEISEKNSFSNKCISFEEISGNKCEPWSFKGSCHDTIILPHSSGTTGLPKGVELSHYNFLATLHHSSTPEFQLVFDAEEKQDVIPAYLPFFHLFGMGILLFSALYHGALLVSMPQFTSAKFQTLLRNYKPCILHGPPPLIHLITNNDGIKYEDLRTLRTVFIGAAPLRAEDVERFLVKTQNRIDLFQGFGMTETTALIAMQTRNIAFGLKIGGSGLLLPNTRGKVIPIEGDSSITLGANEPGEILFQGPQMMKGYYKNPEATSATFLPDSWLKTGDIGYFDDDGHLFVTDRLKELIKVKGFSVAPAEVEGVLRQHPSVDEVAVIGVPHSRFGEVPKAFVVLKQGKKATAHDIEGFVAGSLSQHKHLLGGVAFLDDIPKNATGKILRRELRKLL